MRKRTDQLGADMQGGSYAKWLDQTLELVKPPDPPQQKTTPKLTLPKSSQPTPTQINHQDAAKTQPQTQADTVQKKWNEVTLPTPASTYLTGEPSAMTLPYAAGHQTETGRKTAGSTLNDFEPGRHSEMTPTALTHQERQQLKECNYTKPIDVSALLPTASPDARRRENFARLDQEVAGSEAVQKDRYANTLMANVRAATTTLEGELDKLEKARSFVETEMDLGNQKSPLTRQFIRQYGSLGLLDQKIAAVKAQIFDAKYSYLPLMPDFEEKSKYKPNRGHGEVQEPLLGAYYDARAKDPTSLYADVVYDSVNGDEQATRWAKHDAGLAYEDVPEEAVKIFNYLYETQGKEAAHEYIRQVKDPYYSVFQSFMMGVGEGAGVTSLVKTFGGKDTAEYLDQRSSESQRAHPVASNVGNAGGTVATALLLDRLLGSSGHPILSGAVSMGGTTAIQGLGDVAVGQTDLEDYALNVLGSTAGGAVGSAAATSATNLGTKALFKTGLQNNIFANAINQGIGGAAFSTGNAVTRSIVDPNYNPTPEELTKDAAVSFAFQAITSAVRLAGRTEQAKSELARDVTALKRDFDDIAKARLNGGLTPTETIERMKLRSATLRVTIEGTRYIGQGKKVDDALAYLDQLDDFLAEAAKHNTATMLGSGERGLGSDLGRTDTTAGIPKDDTRATGPEGTESFTSTEEQQTRKIKISGVFGTIDASQFAPLEEYDGEVEVIGQFSPIEYVVKIETPTITKPTQHFTANLLTKPDRAGLTMDEAQRIISSSEIVLWQPQNKTLKFLSESGYAVINIKGELVTAVPEKLRKKYKDYLEGK